jgi:hypothetical protein
MPQFLLWLFVSKLTHSPAHCTFLFWRLQFENWSYDLSTRSPSSPGRISNFQIMFAGHCLIFCKILVRGMGDEKGRMQCWWCEVLFYCFGSICLVSLINQAHQGAASVRYDYVYRTVQKASINTLHSFLWSRIFLPVLPSSFLRQSFQGLEWQLGSLQHVSIFVSLKHGGGFCRNMKCGSATFSGTLLLSANRS